MPTLLEIEVDRFFNDAEYFQRCRSAAVIIDADSLLVGMCQHTQRCLYWADLHDIATFKFEQKKAHVNEVIWALAKVRARSILEGQGHKASVDRTEEQAYLDPEYRLAQEEVKKMELVVALLKNTENVLWARKDMLQSLNSRQRSELEAIPDVEQYYPGEFEPGTPATRATRLSSGDQPKMPPAIVSEADLKAAEERIAAMIGAKHGS